MEELRVPTRRVEVEIIFANGAIDRGAFYLTDSANQRMATDELGRLLNDERDFVPFSSADSHVGQSLICKRHLLRVRTSERVTASQASFADSEQRCVVLFDDESRLAGWPIQELPLSCSRLVDKVNQSPPFLAFLTADGLEFVRVAHIVRITNEE